MKSRLWFVLIGFFLLTLGSPPIYTSGFGVLPAGTILNIRTTQPIEADDSHVGMRFPAIVDDPVTVDGRILIPRGSSATLEAVSVERSSNLKGRDRVTLRVLSLHVGGRTYPVSTSSVELKGPSEGKRAARKIGTGAGIGAAVGGLFGGGKGAVIGATAGGTAGAVVAGSGKTHLSVPAETRLQFRLDAPARILQ
jgi:hypothetical protein